MDTPLPEDDPMFPQRWLELFLRYTPEDSSTWTDKEHIEFLMKERMIMSKVMSNLAKQMKIGVDDAIFNVGSLTRDTFVKRYYNTKTMAGRNVTSYQARLAEMRKEIAKNIRIN